MSTEWNILAMCITVSIIRISAVYIQMKRGEFFQNYYVTNLDSNPLLLITVLSSQLKWERGQVHHLGFNEYHPFKMKAS